jgi:hypothetical protein
VDELTEKGFHIAKTTAASVSKLPLAILKGGLVGGAIGAVPGLAVPAGFKYALPKVLDLGIVKQIEAWVKSLPAKAAEKEWLKDLDLSILNNFSVKNLPFVEALVKRMTSPRVLFSMAAVFVVGGVILGAAINGARATARGLRKIRNSIIA